MNPATNKRKHSQKTYPAVYVHFLVGALACNLVATTLALTSAWKFKESADIIREQFRDFRTGKYGAKTIPNTAPENQ